MTEQTKSDHDLLIEIHTRQDVMIEQIKGIKSQQRCHTHTEKLRTHDKFIWGAVLASLGALIKSFWQS